MRKCIVGLLLSMAAFSQSPVFEAASVKVADGNARGNMKGGPGTSDPVLLTMTNVTLFAIIVRAYNLKAYQVSGPDWISSRKYEIAAAVPAGATKEECNLMLQTLLAERFHLVIHRETKTLQGYQLAIGKNGAKLHPAKPVSTEPSISMMEDVRGKAVVSFLTAKAQPVSALADLIGKEFRLPIDDVTGLKGLFDFQLEYAPERPGALPTADDAPLEGAANLTTAVQQQLGLKLNPAKVAVKMLIVDRADQIPTGN